MVSMSLTSQLKMTAKVKADRQDVTGIQVASIIACCPDLSDKDAEQMMTWNKDVLTALSTAAYKISGLGDDGDEQSEPEKN